MAKIISNIEYPYYSKWDKSKNYVSFDIKGVTASLVNGIRRTIISQVNTVGIRTEPYEKNQVEIIQNDTPLHNQFLSHRVSMIPINVPDVNKFNVDDYEIIIDVSNNSNFPKDVTTEDIKVRKISDNKILSDSETRKLFPPNPETKEHILISRLKPKYYQFGNISDKSIIDTLRDEVTVGQSNSMRLYLKSKMCISNGEENGHFNPSSCSVYFNKVDPEKANKAEEQFVIDENDKYIRNNLTALPEEDIRRRFKTTMRDRYFYTDVEGEPYWFTFNIETVGVIPPLLIFHRAIELLKNIINNFRSNIISGDQTKVETGESLELPNAFEVKVHNEDDTLGNILQTYFSNQFAKYGSENRLLNFIGYNKIHPLQKIIKITIQPLNSTMKWEDVVENVINPGCQNIIKILNKLQQELEDAPQFTTELKRIK